MIRPLAFTLVVASVLSAQAAFVYAVFAASRWSEASRVNYDQTWTESGEAEVAHGDSIAVILRASGESATLNKKAAALTKWAVIYGTAASLTASLSALFSLL